MCKENEIPNISPLVTEELKRQMIPIFAKMKKKVRLIAILDFENEKCMEMGSFLKAVKSCSELLELELIESGTNKQIEEELHGEHLPVVGLYTEQYSGACFHGVPGGKEMNSFVATICNLGEAAQPLDKRLKKNIDNIKSKIEIKIFVSLACHHCPHVVAACQKIAIANPNVIADMYDAKLYPDIVEKYHIERVPMMVINESHVIMGQKSMEEIVNRLMNIS